MKQFSDIAHRHPFLSSKSWDSVTVAIDQTFFQCLYHYSPYSEAFPENFGDLSSRLNARELLGTT
jgi:hypothetical protein